MFEAYPEPEELDDDEWKLLFMLLAENRGNLDLSGALAPHGKYLLGSIQRKLGINVVGVATPQGVPPVSSPCPACGEHKLFVNPRL